LPAAAPSPAAPARSGPAGRPRQRERPPATATATATGPGPGPGTQPRRQDTSGCCGWRAGRASRRPAGPGTRGLVTGGQAPAGPPDPGEQAGDWGPPAEPRAAREPSVVVLAATDPASPYGSALPWPDRPGEVPGGHRPGRKAGALVILSDGRLVLYVER